MNIAFLEDNLDFAQDIIVALTNAGHQVRHFLSGRKCLKVVSSERFDLCILDWQIPDMSGAEVLASLKLKGNVPPVIFLTGRDAEEDIVKVMDAGADDYIVKPPNLNVLVARVNAHLRRSQGNLQHEKNVAKQAHQRLHINKCF